MTGDLLATSLLHRQKELLTLGWRWHYDAAGFRKELQQQFSGYFLTDQKQPCINFDFANTSNLFCIYLNVVTYYRFLIPHIKCHSIITILEVVVSFPFLFFQSQIRDQNSMFFPFQVPIERWLRRQRHSLMWSSGQKTIRRHASVVRCRGRAFRVGLARQQGR